MNKAFILSCLNRLSDLHLNEKFPTKLKDVTQMSKGITIAQAAVLVLKEARKPLMVNEIYDRIIASNLYTFNTPAPKNILRAQIIRHCEGKTRSDMSKNKYFVDCGDKHFDLLSHPSKIDQVDTVTTYDKQIAEILNLQILHTNEVKGRIVADLKLLSPEKFEYFSARLLEKYGFMDMHVTSISNDGGVDAYGKLKVGLAYMRVAAQCKRYTGRNKVTRPEIDQFRGAIQGKFEQGIFFTTGEFTEGAKEASFQNGAVPIILIDGQQIAQIMIDQQVGVMKKEISLYSYDIEMAIEMD